MSESSGIAHDHNVLLIDDSAIVCELFAAAIRDRLGYAVETLARPNEVTDDFISARRIDAAIVDLCAGSDFETGIDALLKLHLDKPGTRLIGFTDGQGHVDELTRDAWEALPLASVVSKRNSVQVQLDSIAAVVRHGNAPPDPLLIFPNRKSPWRTLAGFERLVQHRGHARLWATILACGPDAKYQELSTHSGLRLNALRNYRAQLLPELALRGVRDPRVHDLYQFAQRSRPFLSPFMLAKGVSFEHHCAVPAMA